MRGQSRCSQEMTNQCFLSLSSGRTRRRACRAHVEANVGQAASTLRLIGTALSAWLTGQFCLASSAAAAKPSASRPGTSPLTWIRIPVIPVPGWKSTSARVFSVVGAVPCLARMLDNAIEKHAECAAAMSSSGLVNPFGSSERAGQETGNVPVPDDSRVTSPLPSSRLPFQTVDELRVVAIAI